MPLCEDSNKKATGFTVAFLWIGIVITYIQDEQLCFEWQLLS